jgi:hypothetical protein
MASIDARAFPVGTVLNYAYTPNVLAGVLNGTVNDSIPIYATAYEGSTFFGYPAPDGSGLTPQSVLGVAMRATFASYVASVEVDARTFTASDAPWVRLELRGPNDVLLEVQTLPLQPNNVVTTVTWTRPTADIHSVTVSGTGPSVGGSIAIQRVGHQEWTCPN